MWLIDVHTYKLKAFYDSNIPKFAILSHTWGDDELTFQGIQNPEASTWPSFVKVRRTCELALKDGLEWVWIDTCCIDKSSSAELSEAINSMFRWYNGARICYVLLSDFEGTNGVADDSHFSKCVAKLKKCRWFSRGWCLQELIGTLVLIAPQILQFYDKDWVFVSTRHDIPEQLSEVTGICRSMLDWPWIDGFSWKSDSEFSDNDFSHWGGGIFDINMTLLYGEGANAFARLQEEIIKRSADHSVLAWDHHTILRPWRPSSPSALLAEHPYKFTHCNNVLATDHHRRHAPKTALDLTNQGLRVTLRLVRGPDAYDWGVLNCTLADDFSGPLALCLRKTGETGVYETCVDDTPRTVALPREITDAAVDTIVMILPRSSRMPPRLTRTSRPRFRVNVIDSRVNVMDCTKRAQVVEIWPRSAYVRVHAAGLWLDAAKTTLLNVPKITITLPHLPTTQAAHGVRITLGSDHNYIWEAFCDLIVYRSDSHANDTYDTLPEPFQTWQRTTSSASSLSDVCAVDLSGVSTAERSNMVMTVAGLSVDASIKTVGDEPSDQFWQVDLRIANQDHASVLDAKRLTERVEATAIKPKDLGDAVFVARTVTRQLGGWGNDLVPGWGKAVIREGSLKTVGVLMNKV
ncbi:hypothetical protein LTR56_005427 [Elasticomyces elasticus]|nr:hypothetical protein LTR22_015245 [Elasticomyces elasticus]KAK3651918.1 hypothetical protein LTR56_005427 [Elasticomyces elasticus]KAK4927813.1 hypothetical protein LTR49_005439 [Elasticomyces elasticus]KAK5750881.1 hypothetical protein LTS12_019024 [Elasticomyces elasticus]